MRNDPLKRIADGKMAIEDRDARLEQLRAELPEARVIKRITDDHTSRVITFQLLTAEE